MKLIVGLGNPGEKCEQTRHNLGFMVLDRLAQRNTETDENWKHEDKFQSEILHFTFNALPFTLLKPHTFMNNSGQAVQAYARYYKIEPSDITVVYDELDIPMGTIRVRNEGSAGGHNGVKSIIEQLGTDKFMRIRLGIGNEERYLPAEEFVLTPFHSSEQREVEKMINKAVEDIVLIMENGIEKYLSTNHGK